MSEHEELRRKWPKLASHMDEVVKVILHGLMTDGAHHKQHSLECVLGMLTEEEWIKKAHAEFQWEKGIPS